MTLQEIDIMEQLIPDGKEDERLSLPLKEENYYNIVKIFGIIIKIPRIHKYKKIEIQNSGKAGLGNRLNALVYAIKYDNPETILIH